MKLDKEENTIRKVYMRLCPCPRISGVELTEEEFVERQNLKAETCKRCLQPIEYISPKEKITDN